jgi:hypothetical protein
MRIANYQNSSSAVVSRKKWHGDQKSRKILFLGFNTQHHHGHFNAHSLRPRACIIVHLHFSNLAVFSYSCNKFRFQSPDYSKFSFITKSCKLSLCTLQRHVTSGGTNPPIPNLDTRCRSVASFTSRPFCSEGVSPSIPWQEGRQPPGRVWRLWRIQNTQPLFF